MRIHRTTVIRLACVTLTVTFMHVPPSLVAAQTKPDNTAVNKGDRSPAAATADNQSNTRSDAETSRQIRRALVADTSLSTYAHNIKIITRRGKVTLRGPVGTEAGKTFIQAKAADVAGALNVKNMITIAPPKPSK